MHVLLSAYACAPNCGSEPGNGWNWAIHLANLGVEVTVLTRMENRDAIERYVSENSIPANLRFQYVKTRIPRLKPGTLIHYLLWQIAALKVAKNIESDRSFDLVHHVTYNDLKGGSFLWQLGKPFIFGPAGGGQIAPYSLAPYFGRAWFKELLRSVIRDLIKLSPFHRKMALHTSLLLVTNLDTALLAEQIGAKKIELFFDLGLPLNYYPKKLPERRYTDLLRLIWVGKLIPRKGLKLALEALSRVRIPYKLTVVGDGPQGREVQKWILEKGLEEKVKWIGAVPWVKVRSAYQKHDVLLFTSLRDSSGTQLLEAMSQGLPIITLDHHGARDFVPEKASIKVPVSDAEGTANALARAIETFYELPASEKGAMAEAAFAFSQQHSWPRKAEQMVKYYQKVLRS